jgi:hypothetical protein
LLVNLEQPPKAPFSQGQGLVHSLNAFWWLRVVTAVDQVTPESDLGSQHGFVFASHGKDFPRLRVPYFIHIEHFGVPIEFMQRTL